MSSTLIFPLTIENRKVILLDLHAAKTPTELPLSAGNDIYIVELPVHGSNSLLTINKKNVVQSLESSIPDIPVNKLDIKLECAGNVLKLTMEEAVNEPTTEVPESFPFSGGYCLVRQEDETYINILLQKDPVFSDIHTDQLDIQFIFKVQHFYALGLLKMYLADRNAIKYLGFDFGSEASQMAIGQRGNNATIHNHPVPLFDTLKRFYKETDTNGAYEQSDEDSSLYKSRFYIEKEIDQPQANHLLPASLKLITRNESSGNPVFLQQHYLVPNLKLIHGNPDFVNKFTFENRSTGHVLSFADVKDKIYARLLHCIMEAYFSKSYADNAPVFLRFTVLTPNIYTIQEIIKLKYTIRNILESIIKIHAPQIKGIEIENLSESDASFIGCLKHISLSKGKYYIIIDCGKGTTDYSILLAEEGPQLRFKPMYRNGFAGAGNLISFGLLQSAVHHIFSLYQNNEVGLGNAKKYFRKYFSSGQQNEHTKKLYDLVENWKKNFNQLDKITTEKEWDEAKSGSYTIKNIFLNNPDPIGVEDILGEITHACDWGGYVEDSISDIVERIHKSLHYPVREMNKTYKCGGVLLTGRAFNFQLLKSAMLNNLRSIPGMESLACLNDEIEMNLKKVCLEGVFERSILIYSDIASTPFEVERGTDRQIVRKNKKAFSIISAINKFLNKIGAEQVESYNEDLNLLKVIDTDMSKCQFMSSGRILQSTWKGTHIIEKATVFQARSGIYMRLRDSQQNDHVTQLAEIDMYANAETQKLVLRSLFPGYTDVSVFDIFN